MVCKIKQVCTGLGAAIILLYHASCTSWFDVHPYDVNLKGKEKINEKQIAAIERRFEKKDTLRVAFISDTHLWLSDARDQVDDVNNRNVDFTIHCGDLTDTGTNKEYEWSQKILKRLECPYVAMIGNHDFLGTGDQTYKEMYGDFDFTLIASRIKFIFINTNATEYDYMAAIPDFEFMEKEAATDSDLFDRTIVVMHAPPYSDQFNNNVCKFFRRYLDYYPGLMCCVYGHNHSDAIVDYYKDGLLFYGVDCARHRNYLIFTFTPDSYEVEQIYF